jgi:uncharacterized membrane protein/protein-disulfide isomerase
MSKRAALFALACALTGLAASAAAAYTHYHLIYDPAYHSFCDVSEAISCTQVYQSRFSTVAGVPVAIFGAIAFVAATLLAVAGLTARQELRESVPAYLLVLSTLSLAVVLYLGYASLVLVKAVCLLCLTTYVAVIGLFIVSAASTNVPVMSMPRRSRRDLRALAASPIAIVLTVLFAAGAGGTLAFFPREAVSAAGVPEPAAPAAPTETQRSEFERWYVAQPRVPLVVPSEGAKVLIVKFNDYQCPACAQSFLQYKPILARCEAEHPGAVKVVLKDYPLNRDCNDNISQTLHPSACDAAVAVRLARQHNRGEEMENWFYTHQPEMTPPSVRQAARDIGQVTNFDAQYAATLSLVKSDIALGKALALRGTPTFFINGVRIDSVLAPQYFDEAINYELQHAATKD